LTFQIAMSPRVRRSPFFEATVKAGATAFSIYNHMYLPTSYGDPEGEYWRLINGVSMWDVAAERQVEFLGPDAAKLAQYVTPRNLSSFSVGQGKYVPICDHDGYLLSDPILMKLADDRFWLSIADGDILLWAKAVAAERRLDVEVEEPDVSPLAVQGPRAEDVIAHLVGNWVCTLKYFWFRKTKVDEIPIVVARSGWSKQGGFELYLLDGSKGQELWDSVAKMGKKHGIGPGCPDAIERIESGLLAFGGDTHPDTTPFEVGLGKYVDLKQRTNFIGKAALKKVIEHGPARRQVGLFIAGRALPNNEHRWPIFKGRRPVGLATAATHSLRLKKNIALALIDAAVKDRDALEVETPKGRRKAKITGLPFC